MSEKPDSGKPILLFAEQCEHESLHEENQDSVLHVRIPLGELLIVADGIGGDSKGAAASRMAVERIYAHLSALPQDYPASTAIRAAAAHASASIYAAANAPDSPRVPMGSTVVLALVQQGADGTQAWIGNVGDSRAYLVRAGRMHRLTTDHSAVQSLLSRDLITPEEAQHHPDSLMLTRSLGRKPEVEIDIEHHPLAAGDTLLLCSDGLWGFVPERDIQRVVESPGLSVEGAARNLFEQALAAGGQDNIGIEMVRLIEPPGKVAPQAENYVAVKVVVAVVLVAFAALCVLVYLTFWNY